MLSEDGELRHAPQPCASDFFYFGSEPGFCVRTRVGGRLHASDTDGGPFGEGDEPAGEPRGYGRHPTGTAEIVLLASGAGGRPVRRRLPKHGGRGPLQDPTEQEGAKARLRGLRGRISRMCEEQAGGDRIHGLISIDFDGLAFHG